MSKVFSNEVWQRDWMSSVVFLANATINLSTHVLPIVACLGFPSTLGQLNNSSDVQTNNYWPTRDYKWQPKEKYIWIYSMFMESWILNAISV